MVIYNTFIHLTGLNLIVSDLLSPKCNMLYKLCKNVLLKISVEYYYSLLMETLQTIIICIGIEFGITKSE